MTAIEKMADSIFSSVKQFIGGEIARLEETIKAIPAGKDGERGKPGEDGAQGEKGDPGVDGKDGRDGADGAPGLAGDRGEKGEPGADGKSVSPEDVDAIVERRVEEAVRKAMAAVVVKDGEPGADGRDGQRGEPGRDAAQIDILPNINLERSYPRGMFATHKGGLWRTNRTTDGMDGWECVVEGVADIALSFDGRKGIVSIAKSSGLTAQHEFSVGAMLYKGVFKEGDFYEAGDTVTWGGSLWHCNEPTTDKPIEGTKSWQLAAKRGRDGRDGINGKDLTKAVALK